MTHENYKILVSPYTRIFYNEWVLNQDRTDYNIVFDQSFKKEPCIKRLNQAIHKLISNYVVLNSHLYEEHGDIFWIPNKKIYPFILANSKNIDTYINKPFNLLKGPLYRFLILRSFNYTRIIIIFHHVLIDGSTFNHFIEKFVFYYNNLEKIILIPLQEQRDKIFNLSYSLIDKLNLTKEQSHSYWKGITNNLNYVDFKFLMYTIPLSNKLESHEISNNKTKVDEIRFEFDKKILKQLDVVKNKYCISPYTFSQIIFALLISKYTGIKNFAVSYPVSIKEGNDLIYGAQVNTNLITYNFGSANNILDIIYLVRKQIEYLKNPQTAYKYYPIYDILSISNNNILTLCFSQTEFKDTCIELDGERGRINSKFNIDLINDLIFEQEKEYNIKLKFRVRYKTLVINKFLLKFFINSYKYLFIQILNDLISFINSNKELKYIKQYSCISKYKYIQLINKLNATYKLYPQNKTIPQLFEDQVQKTPNNLAVVYQNNKLTYQELNNKSNAFANIIIKKTYIKPDTLIALCLERNEQMIIAILSVLKSGAAYVPIDPCYPEDRIKYILQDTDAKLVISNNTYIKKLQTMTSSPILDIGKELYENTFLSEYYNNLKRNISSQDLAYVIYTSGTTGQPKGVMVEHKSAVNTILSLSDVYDFKVGNKSTAYSSYVFDVSISEIFTVILKGGELHLLSEEVRMDPTLISKYINTNNINYLYLPPAILTLLPRTKYSSIKAIIYAGEPCDVNTGKYWSNNYKLYNYYGPTETTIYSCGKQVIDGDTNLIGTPINNTICYILDDNLNHLPVGAIGELYIGGVGVARGYLNNLELTKQKFISNPFQSWTKKICENNRVIYKTGDLVRLLWNGHIEYLGRIDSQVKINGYRIELEEIEKVLAAYKDIKQSIIIIREHKIQGSDLINKQLIGYYISNKKLNEKKILEYLKNKLPIYMIPYSLIHLQKFPVTINGKIDRNELLKSVPKSKKIIRKLKPQTESEKIIANILKSIININVISVRDNLFELGLDSIQAIQLLSRLANNGLHITIDKLRQNPTIRQISHLRDINNKKKNYKILESINELKPIPLTPRQNSQFIFHTQNSTLKYWNIPFVFITKKKLIFDYIEQSVKSLVKHHDTLRLKFQKDDHGRWVQLYDSYDNIIKDTKRFCKEIDLTNIDNREKTQKEIKEIYQEISDSINVETGPLFIFAVIESKNSQFLLVVLHHGIADLISFQILIEDFEKAYIQASNNLTIDLGDKTSLYSSWSFAIAQYSYSDHFKNDKNYWYKEYTSNTVIPTDFDIKEQSLYKDSCILNSKLSQHNTKVLLKKISDISISMPSFIFAKLARILLIWSGYDTMSISIIVHGRNYNTLNIDVSRTLGYFMIRVPVNLYRTDLDNIYFYNTLEQRIRISSEKSLAYSIISSDYSCSLKSPQISINYLGNIDSFSPNHLLSHIKVNFKKNDNFSNIKTTILIFITIYFKNGQLFIDWEYSGIHYSKDTIKCLAMSFIKELSN